MSILDRGPSKGWKWVIFLSILCCLPLMIVGPLFNLALTTSRNSGEGTLSAKCVSRLRQVSQGIMLYAADFDGAMPSEKWIDETWKYATEKNPDDQFENIYRCPSVSVKRIDAEWGYAFNIDLVKVPKSTIENPAETGLVFDSILPNKNAVGTLDTLPKPPRHMNAKENHVVSADLQLQRRGQ